MTDSNKLADKLADALARLHENLSAAPPEAEKCFVSLDDHRTILAAHEATPEASSPGEAMDRADRLRYIAECITTHADKFPVPSHMHGHAAFLKGVAATVSPSPDVVGLLREALKPFAAIAPAVEHTDKRDSNVVHRQVAQGVDFELTKDDFRRAAEALNRIDAETGTDHVS